MHLIIWFGYMKLFQRREKAINIRADEFIQQKNIAAMRPFIRREAEKNTYKNILKTMEVKMILLFYIFLYLFCSINKNKIQFKLFNYFIYFYSFL